MHQCMFRLFTKYFTSKQEVHSDISLINTTIPERYIRHSYLHYDSDLSLFSYRVSIEFSDDILSQVWVLHPSKVLIELIHIFLVFPPAFLSWPARISRRPSTPLGSRKRLLSRLQFTHTRITCFNVHSHMSYIEGKGGAIATCPPELSSR